MILRSYRIPGVHVTEHRITVPLDWDRPEEPGRVEIFARELCDPARVGEDLPLMLFLQGGPGGAGPRPVGSGWWQAVLPTHRLVLLDQRGTGRSSPVDADRIAAFDSGADAADFLCHFRGDAIVRDAEALRTRVYGGRRWSTLGQSYGGFLTLTYLSRAPWALEACYVTGGLVSPTAGPEEVYAATVGRVVERNRAFARAYPDDWEDIDEIAEHLASHDVRLPNGDRLTEARFQTLGMVLGMSTGAEELHFLIDTAWTDGRGSRLSRGFLTEVARRTGFETDPLYAVLQEAIYAQGRMATDWAAARAAGQWHQLDPSSRPLMFTGEMMFPAMFFDHAELRAFQPAMEELHAVREWPWLYDVVRLARNEVPVAAVLYHEDPYVDLDLGLEGARRVGNTRVWVTSEYLHDGLRRHGDVILPRLFDMVAGRAELGTVPVGRF